jgi:arylsulfatase A-like enzyme
MRNVLMLVYDSVRPDYLGSYAGRDAGTHGIDSLAETGALFERVISSSAWTLPCIGALISGVDSHRLGLFRWEQEWPREHPTLFHYFGSAGYDVGSFVFDEKYMFAEVPEARVRGHSRDLGPACDFLRERRNVPFFLFVHSWRTHIPWVPQPSAESWRKEVRRLQEALRTDWEAAAEECRSLYRGSIEAASEEELPRLRDALRSSGALEDTVVVFTSDHGETWGERAGDKDTITDNFALHGRYLYDESIRVPLIISVNEGGWPGRRVTNQVRSIDVAPTVLDLCGIEHDPGSMDGYSLRSSVGGEDNEDREALISTTDSKSGQPLTVIAKIAVKRPPWKLIWTLSNGKRELYNTDEDPGETRDRYGELESAPWVKGMMENLNRELEAARPYSGTEDEMERLKEQLRGLGYL